MADASPNSTKDLEIVEVVDESKDLGNGEEGKDIGEGEKEDKDEIVIETNDELGDNNSKSDKGSEKDFEATTKSDTSAMDARSIRSRVFVGHLNTERASRRDLEKLFSSCGKVIAISLLNGYGFVQFDNEESARKAIEEVHGTPFFGMKLVVDKPAAWKRLDGENPKEPKPWPKDPKRPFVPDDDDDYHRSNRRRNRRRGDDFAEYDAYYYDYYEDLPPRYHDPYYERYLEMRYMEERLAERYRNDYGRYYDRYPSPASRYPDYRERGRYGDRYSERYEPTMVRYERPRDDEYDRRRPFDSYYH